VVDGVAWVAMLGGGWGGGGGGGGRGGGRGRGGAEGGGRGGGVKLRGCTITITKQSRLITDYD